MENKQTGGVAESDDLARIVSRLRAAPSRRRDTTRAWRSGLACMAVLVTLSGCADLTSISRRTSLPGKDDESRGTAIHLDAKQRLVFAKAFGIVCAEPSPDALSAVAASLGGGIAAPTQGALSVAQALNETSASIGLRTQSITLMRDIMYRTCEGYYSRGLTGPQYMQLLARSQDVTIGVLAIEQLTGAIAARQAALGGSAGASSSANLLTIQNLLDAARQNETQKAETLERETAALQEKNTAVAAKETELKNAQTAGTDTTQLTVELNTLKEEQKVQNAKVEQAKIVADDAKKTRELIESNRDAATTSASATAAGSGVFAPNTAAVNLSDQSAQHIASAVAQIVSTIVQESHVEDACVAAISDNPPKDATPERLALYHRGVNWCLTQLERGRTGSERTGEPVSLLRAPS
jgi:hypothetical protein